MESLTSKYGSEASTYPNFDVDSWMKATGGPMKGRLYGFGSAADLKVILRGSCSFSASSRYSSAFSSSSQGLSQDQIKEVEERIRQELEQKMEDRLRQKEREIDESINERVKEMVRLMLVEVAQESGKSPRQVGRI